MISEKEIEAANKIALGKSLCNMEKALEAAGQARWQPIETAPKDGREVLLSEDGDIVIGWFGEDRNVKGKTWLFGTGDDFSTGYYYIPINPTHWQPLPEPPKTNQEE